MRCIIVISAVIFNILLTFRLQAQTVWQESFSIAGKGFWMDDSNILQSDFSGVDWNVAVQNANFIASGDYSKTVSTSGGRFEVIDSDGDILWYSPKLEISNYSVVTISVKTSETGSSTGSTKKYIKASYLLDHIVYPFQPDSVVSGNWGEKTLTAKSIKGENLQLIITMNSSYSNDKVIIDEVMVEGIDSSLFEPQRIAFTNLPTFTFKGEETKLTASVFNKRGEIVTNKEYHLTFKSSCFTVKEADYNQGIYTWLVTTDSIGKLFFNIQFEDSTVDNFNGSIQVYLHENLLFDDDFETSETNGWQNNNQWAISSDSPISGGYSLKHLVQEANGKSSTSIHLPKRNFGDGDYYFSFKLKNGNWDPSSSNLFYLELVDSSSLANGYAVGVNATGSSDMVSLWTLKSGIVTELVTETSFDWGESNCVQIDLSRNATGNWTLTATNMNDGVGNSNEGFNNEFNDFEQIGLNFKFTQTRSGQLCFDDIVVLRENKPPGIKEVNSSSSGTIQICFTEPLLTENLTKDIFKLIGKSGKVYPIDIFQVISSDTILLVPKGVTEADLLLTITTFKDKEGAVSSVVEYPFEYNFMVSKYDIVFTEIMADPTPLVGLPEAEYLEVINRSIHPIDLEKWRLLVKDQLYELPKFRIEAGEYVVICSIKDSAIFTNFGNVLAMGQFPSLLNAGSRLSLVTPDGTVIDELVYSDSWYNDPIKKNGGWSLEKIDPDRWCGNNNNWIASTALSGGTPGNINSVNANNRDTIAPELLNTELVSKNSLKLFFSEIPDTTIVVDLKNYSIDGSIVIDSLYYNEGDNSILLWFSPELTANKPYQLTVTGLSDECGNIGQTKIVSISRQVIRSKDIVINELLFNPKSGGSDFVELYNRSGFPIDISKLRLATRNDTLGLKSAYSLSTKELEFPDQSYLVFTKDSLDLTANYWVTNPEKIVQMSSFPSYPDDEGRVVLLNDSLGVIDEFDYSETMHSVWLSDFEGVSLERQSFTGETNDRNNWHSASSLAGYATPGYENSQQEPENPNAVTLLINPDAISPNNDGYNDEMEISFHLDKPGYIANIYVFDVAGRKVNRLLNNSLIGTDEKIYFGGLSANETLLPLGIYILLAELIHSDGDQKVFKQAFLITDRR